MYSSEETTVPARPLFEILTALVEPVQPVDVVLAHLGGLAEGHVAVGDGQHSGTVVLGEGVPAVTDSRMMSFSWSQQREAEPAVKGRLSHQSGDKHAAFLKNSPVQTLWALTQMGLTVKTEAKQRVYVLLNLYEPYSPDKSRKTISRS